MNESLLMKSTFAATLNKSLYLADTSSTNEGSGAEESSKARQRWLPIS